MNDTGNQNRRTCWKHYVLLLILLSHTIFGSPVVTTDKQFKALGPSRLPVRQIDDSSMLRGGTNAALNEDIFGAAMQEEDRQGRQKRTIYETWKKAKRIKLISLGEASASAAKSVGKSIIKNVITLGLKAIIFNFLYTKINRVLDFKNRMLTNLEQKNREQNAEILGIGESPSEKSVVTSSTENPDDQIPDFNPEKISLALPDALFKPSFSLANGISQVVGTLIQNKANRLARLFESMKPFLSSSVGLKSKKRQTDDELLENFEGQAADKKKFDTAQQEMPIKTSYTALIQER